MDEMFERYLGVSMDLTCIFHEIEDNCDARGGLLSRELQTPP